MEKIKNKTEQIREYILAEYPTLALPYGAAGKIAKRFSISRQLVHQIVHALSPTALTLCMESGCTTPKLPGAHYCLEHRDIPISCSNCERVKRITRQDFLQRMMRLREGLGEHWYCSVQCAGRAKSKKKSSLTPIDS